MQHYMPEEVVMPGSKLFRAPSHAISRVLSFALSVTLGSHLVFSASMSAAQGAAVGQQNFPQIELNSPVNGNAAVNALGGKLPDIAESYGMTASELARTLRTDRTLWVDTRGRLFYKEELPDAAEAEPSDPLQDADYPLADTFTLHSRPGSKRVIYLDFDGHVTENSAWNSGGPASIVSPAYTRDSDPAFSNTELVNIQKMWRQVAEDFAPFDVNITTEDPGQAAITRSSSSDDIYGARVVITKDNFDNCGCGGFAYVGVYSNVGDYYSPAFVFNTSLVGAGEAISHEVGHNLGLSHDGGSGVSYYEGHGSGDTGWAPIMGVGYYQSLVQWSKGEYSGATQSQDDIVVIQNNGAPLMVDDHGNNAAGASALTASSDGTTASLSGSGVIERREDIDVFTFLSGAGDYTINVDPAPFSPNLDIEATLLDNSGDTIASSNPADSLPATLSGSLIAGEYFLHIEGVDKGDVSSTGYSDYGSLGRYSVTGSVVDAAGLAGPVASFTTQPAYTPTKAPVTVNFDGTASVDPDGPETGIVNWLWNFGDGSPEANGPALPDLTHQYLTSGTFTVTLTVTDFDSLTDSASMEINVVNQPPQAVASASVPSEAAPNAAVAFVGSGSTDADSGMLPLTYSWTFGDGNSSTAADPTHTYTTAGLFQAGLTVTDNLGDSDTATVDIVVEAPAFYDQTAVGEQYGAGTVTGDYTNTVSSLDATQSIRERESGGKKSARYSYLEHIWQFNVKPGAAVTLTVRGNRVQSTENEPMVFAYAVAPDFDDADYIELGDINLGTTVSSQSQLLQVDTGGETEVRIRVRDRDRAGSSRTLDTVVIDQIVIRTDNEGGTVNPPEFKPATGLTATVVSGNQVDFSWSHDASGGVAGSFEVARSENSGSSWLPLGTSLNRSYNDTSVFAGNTYSYSVVAVADSDGSSATAAILSDVVVPGATGNITLTAQGRKVKGNKIVTLTWSPAANVQIKRNGADVATTDTSPHEDSLGKGGGTYTYQVCDATSPSNCSNEATVVF
jgi:PKD repeat protein